MFGIRVASKSPHPFYDKSTQVLNLKMCKIVSLFRYWQKIYYTWHLTTGRHGYNTKLCNFVDKRFVRYTKSFFLLLPWFVDCCLDFLYTLFKVFESISSKESWMFWKIPSTFKCEFKFEYLPRRQNRRRSLNVNFMVQTR